MKKTIIQLFTLVLFPLNALANCGYLPTAPELLTEPQLTADQFNTLSGQMDAYIEQIELFQNCIKEEINQLAPADATQEYFSSSQYQTAYAQKASWLDLSREKMQQSMDRYNDLVQIGSAQ